MPDGDLDLNRLRSIGHVSGLTTGRSKSGREHPDSGEPYKVTRDELGNDTTEHGKRGAGVATARRKDPRRNRARRPEEATDMAWTASGLYAAPLGLVLGIPATTFSWDATTNQLALL